MEKKHVLAVGKNQCGRAGVSLGDASRGPSLMWIFGVRFEDWLWLLSVGMESL